MTTEILSATDEIQKREKLILAGLYLSKYDQLGLAKLGFDTFLEAYNAIGFALRSKPASVKNYRDEFDPLFPNPRKGWRKRGMRDYCLAVYERYGELDLDSFSALLKSFFESHGVENTEQESEAGAGSSFAQRLITGRCGTLFRINSTEYSDL